MSAKTVLSKAGAPVRITRHDDGKLCARIPAYHHNDQDRAVLCFLGSKEVVAQESIYSGMWYVYDAVTGEDVGSIRRQFFPFMIRDSTPLMPDPDC